MSSPSSPTATGFRLILRSPIIPFAEIAWRWSFGAAAWFLGVMFLFEYANSLPVNAVERLMLGTQQPVLVLRAMQRIFHGSVFRLAEAGVLLAIALVLAWVILASLGRALTVRSLIEELEIAVAAANHRRGVFRSLLALNFLRAAAALAALVAVFGSLLIANSLWASTRASVSDAIRLWFALLFLTIVAWATLNWFLSTAALFVVKDRVGVPSAISSTVHLCLEHSGPVLVAGVLFGLVHLGAFIMASGAALTVLSMASLLGAGPVLFLEVLIAIAYSAVAHSLYAGRLAAYMKIIAAGDVSQVPSTPPYSLPGGGSAVDRSELILSDMPLPAG